MKADEVYRILRQELEPNFQALGCKRMRASRLTFRRQLGAYYHHIWFQCDRWGWDAFAGSSFFVSFSVSAAPEPEKPDRREERLNLFLTDAELEEARALRDRIVARIPRPPESYFALFEEHARKYPDGPGTLETVRSWFEPADLPYRRHQDFGLRYFHPGDLAEWAAFIAPVLPRAVAAMEQWEPAGLAPPRS